jgi:hypothetical protein
VGGTGLPGAGRGWQSQGGMTHGFGLGVAILMILVTVSWLYFDRE